MHNTSPPGAALLLVLLTAALAVAAPTASGATVEARAGYLLRTERPREAAALLAGRLADAPDDLAAHRLYIRSQILLDDAGTVVASYERWHDDDPADPVRRLALAWALRLTGAELCTRMLRLLDDVPAALTFDADRLAHTVSHPCGVSPPPLTPDDPGQWTAALGLAWPAEAIDDVDAVRSVLASEPWRMRDLREAFVDDAHGPALGAVRRALLQAAGGAASADDPVLVHAALSVYRAADRQRAADAARERLDALEGRPVDVSTAALRTIAAVRRAPTYEAQLAALDAIPHDAPPRVVAAWNARRAHVLEALSRHDEALEARRRAATATPNDLGALEAWVAAAIRQGRGLEAARDGVGAALEVDDGRLAPRVRAQYARPRLVPGRGIVADDLHTPTMEEWRDTAGTRRGVLLLLAGRLDRALGRPAASTLRAALLLGAPPEVHLELGLAIAEDDPDASWAHLVRGLALAPHAPAAADARIQLRSAWPTRGLWHPGGLDGWLVDAVAREPRPEAPKADDDPSDHPLVGHPFPLDEVVVDGEAVALSDLGGPLVVDLWATWCGPCVDALPHLARLAEAYAPRGVSVVGVSVDERERAVHKFLRRRDLPFPMAWTGPSTLRGLSVRSIPAQFVLDEEHRVVACIRGYRGDTDHRLEAVLDEHLAR